MDEEKNLDLQEYFHIIKKRKKTILLITILCTVISALVSFYVIIPVYEAKTMVIIGKTAGEKNDRIQYDEILMYQNLVKTYSEIAKSRTVAEKTSDKMTKVYTIEKIMKATTIVPQPNTQIITISMKAQIPGEALELVNCLTDSFIQEAKRIFPDSNLQIMDKAQVPQKPILPNKILNISVAFFLGLMLSAGLAFLIEYFDNTIKSEEDVERYIELPIIGVIAKDVGSTPC